MPLQIVRNDITRMEVDAIVNAANHTLLGGGGVDGAIHAAAGPELLDACRELGGCQPGQAKVTAGYRLPARYVIHTVGSIYQDGRHGEEAVLRSCYRNALALAKELRCRTVAVPLISAGSYGYPREEALQIAVSEISRFLLEQDMLVYLVIYDRSSFQLSKRLMRDVTEYIDEHYVEEHGTGFRAILSLFSQTDRPEADTALPLEATSPSLQRQASVPRLEDMMAELDESFAQMLLRKIDERGITDVVCYKKANIDRKLFSKIRSKPQYKPSKSTAIAFAIALELDWTETGELLRKAGYALSHSSKFDIIVEYFIRTGNYNIFELNEVLFQFDQPLLGG